jgi:cytoskeletal protein RodZ
MTAAAPQRPRPRQRGPRIGGTSAAIAHAVLALAHVVVVVAAVFVLLQKLPLAAADTASGSAGGAPSYSTVSRVPTRAASRATAAPSPAAAAPAAAAAASTGLRLSSPTSSSSSAYSARRPNGTAAPAAVSDTAFGEAWMTEGREYLRTRQRAAEGGSAGRAADMPGTPQLGGLVQCGFQGQGLPDIAQITRQPNLTPVSS